jgi:hypothetical protein
VLLDALQNDRLGVVVDAADSTPIATPHPDRVSMGEDLDPDKQSATVSRR